jgi:hypothetical protein
MVVETDNDQRIAFKLSTQAQTVSLQMNQKSRYSLAAVE